VRVVGIDSPGLGLTSPLPNCKLLTGRDGVHVRGPSFWTLNSTYCYVSLWVLCSRVRYDSLAVGHPGALSDVSALLNAIVSLCSLALARFILMVIIVGPVRSLIHRRLFVLGVFQNTELHSQCCLQPVVCFLKGIPFSVVTQDNVDSVPVVIDDLPVAHPVATEQSFG